MELSPKPDPQTTPTVITLDNVNSIRILSQYIEVAQQKGAYVLAEAELLKRSTDVLVNNVPDAEITQASARQLLIQGVHKGQRHGAYTLNDAALLSKVVQFVNAQNTTPAPQSVPAPAPQPEQTSVQQSVPVPTPQPVAPVPVPTPAESLLDDLADLAEPIPLKPKEV